MYYVIRLLIKCDNNILGKIKEQRDVRRLPETREKGETGNHIVYKPIIKLIVLRPSYGSTV
jgi:hypothetical protein